MPGGSETTTQEAPQEVTEYFNQFINPAAENISNMEFQAYGGDRVAGLSDLERSALSGLGGLPGQAAAAMQPGMDTMGQAQAQFGSVAADAQRTPAAVSAGLGTLDQAQSAYSQLGDIASMTPEDYRRRTEANLSGYTTGVIDPALARMNRAAAEAQTQQQAEFAKAGGFGNERRGIYEAELAARQGESRDQLISNLMRQGYNEAQAATMAQMGQGIGAQQAAASGLAGLGAQQAGLGLRQQQSELAARQAAASGLAGLGAQQAGLGLQGQAAELQALQAQLAGGGLQRGVDQAGLEAQYQEFMRQQQFPLQQFAALTGGSASYPGGGTTTTRSQAGLGDIFGFLFSDRRLKKNVTLLNTVNGVNYYRWQWNDEAQRIGADSTPPVGVIAQELQETHPHLVVAGADGYLMVNYGGLAD